MAKQPNNIEDCTETTKNPIISIMGKGKESGKKIVFHNKARNEVRKIQVDGCVITTGKRCDWLVKDKDDGEFFIELKGTSILNGCEQLGSSIMQLSSDPRKKVKHSFIICSSFSPKIKVIIPLP